MVDLELMHSSRPLALEACSGSSLSDEEDLPHYGPHNTRRGTKARFYIRCLALLCACSLSIGSHYASYILGPLKSRLAREMGTSNAQFSLLISAYSLSSTWTPLIGGLLTTRLGTAWTSILATSIILIGQIVLLIGNLTESIPLMVFGMFVFGLGISPLSVVQETIIVRFFKSHGLGVSLALGLVAGKGASFIAASTSYSLSERLGPHAPFTVATLLATFSFAMNVVYLLSSKWFVFDAHMEPEDADSGEDSRYDAYGRMSESEATKHVAAKRTVHLRAVTKLGDVFWLYIAVNVLCGLIWSPFTHLSANIIENRYSLSEARAGQEASLLLAGSIILYPVCGYITDRVKYEHVVYWLFALSSVLTFLCYFWLVLPPQWTLTPFPAMISFGIGHGFATLLLVIIVPRLVTNQYVPTALGIHKSVEQAGSTISQTIAGLVLDLRGSDLPSSEISSDTTSISRVLRAFLFINFLQLLGVLLLWAIDAKRQQLFARQSEATEYQLLRDDPSQIDRASDIQSGRSGSCEGVPETRPSPAEDHLTAFQEHGSGPTNSGISSSERLFLSQDRSLEVSDLLSISNTQQLFRGMAWRLAQTRGERLRGSVGAYACVCLVFVAWVLFLAAAWTKLRTRE